MKNAKWRLLATVLFSPIFSSMAQQPEAPVPQVSIATGQAPAGAPAVPSTLSSSVAEVIKLSESGTGEEVVLAYIQNSSATFNLTADDILYLRDIGISSTVISAMINHDT